MATLCTIGVAKLPGVCVKSRLIAEGASGRPAKGELNVSIWGPVTH
jgi:hypothetical protein